MPKYILHYFETNARGVIARAILSCAKADWTNDLVKKEDWPKLKKSGLCEYEQLPVLEVDGKKYSQSHAINLYLAQVFNIMGKDAEENYQITNVLMAFEDYMAPIWKTWFITDEAKKAEQVKEAEEKLKFFFGKFEKKYVDLGKGKYYLGDKLTLADIVLAAALPAAVDALKLKDFPCKELASNLSELIKRIKENELKEFYEKFYIK